MIPLIMSDAAASLIAGAAFIVISCLIALGTLNSDMKEHPWKYKKFLDADEAKKKVKEQAKEQKNH